MARRYFLLNSQYKAFQQVAFSFDGKTIAATVTEGPQRNRPISRPIIEDVLKLWDAKTLVLKQTLGLGGLSHLACIAFSPDGKRVTAGDPSKKIVKLWNAETGSLERTLQTGSAQPWSMAFSPDGKTLVVGGLEDDRSFESLNEVNLVSGQIQWWDAVARRKRRGDELPGGAGQVRLGPVKPDFGIRQVLGGYHLLWAYDPLQPEEEKWFLVWDPLEDKLETWLHVGFARWPVERTLEDKKSELGLSHFEVRKYQAVMRHLYITMVSYLFLARQTERLRGEKPADHAEPGPRRRQRTGHYAPV